MERVANRRNSRVVTRSKVIIWASLSLTLVGLCRLPEVAAEDLKSASAQFAEQSFALLDRLSKQGGNNGNPTLGPIANFAADADGLRQSLARSDLRSARYQITLLQTDASAVDRVIKQHPNSTLAAQWSTLRERAEELAHKIPPCVSPSACSSPPATESGSASVINAEGYAPKIVITSRESGGGFLRLQGYVEGRALKSAGIYQDSVQLKALKVVDTPGRQRVEFDLRFEEPSPATILRTSDADGRTTEAPIVDPSSAPSPLPSTAEISPDSVAPIASTDTDAPPPNLGEDASTEEIPSRGPLIPSPSKRHTLASKLGDVRINILSVRRIGNLPPTYEIIGQIEGRGITRAGIYLNGRLLRSIPITSSAHYTSFDQRVVARGGSTTIRAYTVGNQSIEQPVDLSEAPDAAFSDPGGNRDN